MGIGSGRAVHWYSPGVSPVRLSLVARAQDTFSWSMAEKSSVGFTCAQPILPPITSSVSGAEDGVNYQSSASVPYNLLKVMRLEAEQQAKGCAANPAKFCNLPGSLWANVSYISSAFVAKDPLIWKGGAVALQKKILIHTWQKQLYQEPISPGLFLCLYPARTKWHPWALGSSAK